MKTLFLKILFIFVFVAAMSTNSGICEASGPPQINVSLAVGTLLPDDTFVPGNAIPFSEPIYAVISIGIPEVFYTSAGFLDRDFGQYIQFTLTRPDGTEVPITATVPADITLRPPRIDPETGAHIEGIDELHPGGWTVGPFAIQDHYTLRSGTITGRVVFPLRAYPLSAIQEKDGFHYARLDSASWSGQIIGRAVSFSIEGQFCPAAEHTQALEMEYTGRGCDVASNFQDNDTCEGDPGGASPVRIRVTDKSAPFHHKARVWFDGEVNLYDTFVIDATQCQGDNCSGTETRLGGDIWIYIMDHSDNILQAVKFHSSCSQEMYYGDQFGSLRLLGITYVP